MFKLNDFQEIYKLKTFFKNWKYLIIYLLGFVVIETPSLTEFGFEKY